MPHQDMHQRDERWELASRAAQEGIWDWNLTDNKVYRSDYWFEMFGYEPGELADNPWVWENMIHPEDAAIVLEARRKHIEGLSDRYYVEHRVLCKDGQYRWFLSRGQVIRDEQGNPVRMIGFYTNIEARVAAREQLMRQNKALRILNELSLRVLASQDQEVALTYLLNRARDYMNADKAYLFLLDSREDVMRAHSLCGFIGPSILKVKRGEFLVGRVWETGEYAYQDHFDQWPGRPPTPDSSQIKTGIGIPLKSEQELLGVITMGFQNHRTVAEDEVESLGQFAAIAAQIIVNREKMLVRIASSQEYSPIGVADKQDLRLALIQGLIEGKPMTARELSLQARRCGLVEQATFLAMQIEAQFSGQFSHEVSYSMSPNDGCIWLSDGKLNLLCFESAPVVEKREAICKATVLLERIAVHAKAPCCIGIGLPCTGLREIGAAFQQAAEALEIGPRLHPDKKVHYYLDVGLIHVLSRQKDRRYVDVYLQQTLGKLVKYDQQKNGHLLDTLTAILKEPSLRGAAEALYIHTKTLLFRKQKIEELIGESLDDPAIRLNLMLALQLHGVQLKTDGTTSGRSRP